jgi:primosomal protein N' (replication factor Y)
MPDACSNCRVPGLKHWGQGTERIESEVRRAFPEARIARMDSDTMSRRTAYLEALGGFREGRVDILVGTQMIAKGLDFPNVTLVGVVLADTALHMPDFRSRERTFQLLAQVAGRAGRSEKGGRVLIQTHLPQDPSIRAAIEHDFETFSLRELQERRAYGYPPFTRLARVLISGEDPRKTQLAAVEAADALRTAVRHSSLSTQHSELGTRNSELATRDSALITHHSSLVVLGPAEAPLSKLEGRYRHHILLKAADSDALADLLAGPAGDAIARLKGADATVDVDPLAML